MAADPRRNTVAPQSAPESNPMTFSSRLLIRQLEELAGLLRGARHKPCDVRALAAVVDHIKALIAGDGLGRRIDSVPELVLRAQGRLVLTALTALGELAADPAARHRVDTLVLTPFHQLEDWIAYVAHELNGSAQGWIRYQEDVASDPAPTGQRSERPKLRCTGWQSSQRRRHFCAPRSAAPIGRHFKSRAFRSWSL
jgi:hypothetical protein